MPDWVIITTLLVLALILGCGLLLLARQRKKERTELRLLVGRRQLLSRELTACFAELETVDDDAIAASRREAEAALDQLHVALIERQAHLLDCEDMAHLQRCKIDLLAASPAPPDPALVAEDPPASPARRPRRQPAPPQGEDQRDRSAIENDLLRKINQLKDGKKPKK